jgi:hypothetical protein
MPGYCPQLLTALVASSPGDRVGAARYRRARICPYSAVRRVAKWRLTCQVELPTFT